MPVTNEIKDYVTDLFRHPAKVRALTEQGEREQVDKTRSDLLDRIDAARAAFESAQPSLEAAATKARVAFEEGQRAANELGAAFSRESRALAIARGQRDGVIRKYENELSRCRQVLDLIDPYISRWELLRGTTRSGDYARSLQLNTGEALTRPKLSAWGDDVSLARRVAISTGSVAERLAYLLQCIQAAQGFLTARMTLDEMRLELQRMDAAIPGVRVE